MSKTINIGKNTLGSGGKMEINLHNYDSSTSDKVYRIYQVVEETTGLILTKEFRKNYITIKIEKNEYTNEFGQKIEITTRVVKHNGQQELFNLL